MPFRYPVSLDVEGRRCVVVGGGLVAERKCLGLLDAGGAVFVVAERVTPDLEELATQGVIELARRPYAYGDLAGALLAFAATDNPAVHADVLKEGEERGVLVNTADDGGRSDFAVPSVLRRGDLAVAVSTGGKAPALARHVRSELEGQLGPELATVVDLLAEERDEAMATRDVDFPAWSRRWQATLDQDVAGLVRSGRLDEARQVVRRSLRGDSSVAPAPKRGSVAIVGAGPGDPGLLSVRGRELLDAAEVVVHDRLVDPSLVEGLGDKDAVFVGKEAGHHAVPQEEINALLVDLAGQGRRVVRLKGGDPFVFGRGGEEAEALAGAGVDFEVVPGPTSAFAALAYAGIPVTHRDVASSVAVVTGHCTGDRSVDWRGLATAVDTIVVLMGLRHLEHICGELVSGGRDPRTLAAVVENGTRSGQRVVTAELAALSEAAAEAEMRPPAVAVVGEVVGLRDRIAWFEES